MSGKNYFTTQNNFQSTTPVPFAPNQPLSGVTSGLMTGSSTIYSNILDLHNYDNSGLEVAWTGTPTGTIQVMCSNSGQAFYALTFNPLLTQPSGSAGGYLIDLNQVPFKYVMVQYTNSSGSGLLTVWLSAKALN